LAEGATRATTVEADAAGAVVATDVATALLVGGAVAVDDEAAEDASGALEENLKIDATTTASTAPTPTAMTAVGGLRLGGGAGASASATGRAEVVADEGGDTSTFAPTGSSVRTAARLAGAGAGAALSFFDASSSSTSFARSATLAGCASAWSSLRTSSL